MALPSSQIRVGFPISGFPTGYPCGSWRGWDASTVWQNKAGARYLGVNSGYFPHLPFPRGSCHPASTILLGLRWEGLRVFNWGVESQGASRCATLLCLATTGQATARARTLLPCLRDQPNLRWEIRDCWVPPGPAKNACAAGGAVRLKGTTCPRSPRIAWSPPAPGSPRRAVCDIWGPYTGG